MKDIYIYKIRLNNRVYKSISQLNPEFMWFYFTHKDMPYSFRKGPTLGLPKTLYYRTNAAHSRGSLIQNNLPAVANSSDSLFEFSDKIIYIYIYIKLNISEIMTADVFSMKGYTIYDVLFYFVIYVEFISGSYFM